MDKSRAKGMIYGPVTDSTSNGDPYFLTKMLILDKFS